MSDIQTNVGPAISNLPRPVTPTEIATDTSVNAASDAGAAASASSVSTVPPVTTSATWGKAIAYLFGTVQAIGEPLWTGTPALSSGADGQTASTVDFAVVFGRPSTRAKSATFQKIFFDSVIVYSTDNNNVASSASSFQITLYDGTQTEVDPTIDASEAPFTPAFVGMIYAVFKGYTVPAGQKFPQVQAIISVAEPANTGGARVVPYAPDNSVTYYDNDHSFMWNYRTKVLYCRRKSSSPSRSDSYFDLFDTDAQTKIRSINLDTSHSGTSADFTVCAISPRDDYLYYTDTEGQDTDHCRLICSNMLTSQFVDIVDLVPTLYTIIVFQLQGHDIICASDIFGKIYVWRRFPDNTFVKIVDHQFSSGERNQAVLAFAIMPDFRGSGVEADSVLVIYFVGPLNFLFNITALGRIIITPDGNPAIVARGIITYKDQSSSFLTIKADNGNVNNLAIIANAYMLCVGEGGKYVHVLTSDGTWYKIRTYYYYLETPLSMSEDLVTYNTATVDSTIPIPSGGVASSQEQMFDPNAYAMAYVAGGNFNVVDLAKGQSTPWPQGALRDLPEVGDTDYGIVPWSTSMIFDAVNGSILYAEGTASNKPGRAYYEARSEVATFGYGIANVFNDLSDLAGFKYVDVTDLEGFPIQGMIINQAVSFKDLISQLAGLFRVNVVETPDFNIRFRHSDAPVSEYNIDVAQQVPTNDGQLVSVDLVAADQLPNELQVQYIDPDQQYVIGLQTARRPIYPYKTTPSQSVVMFSVPIVMTAEKAAYWASFALYDMWAGDITYTVTTSAAYYAAQCGDYVTLIQMSGKRNLVQITGIQYNADTTVTLTLVNIVSKRTIAHKQITGGGGNDTIDPYGL